MLASEYLEESMVLARREKVIEILDKIKQPYGFCVENLEKDDDTTTITDVRLEGDKVYTDLEGMKYPLKGYSDMGTVAIVAVYKKLLPLVANNLKKQNWVGRVIIILSMYYSLDVLSKWLKSLFNFGAYLLKEEYYQESTKEFRRVFKKYIDINFVDAITLAYDYDIAYKFRVQDVLPELKKENLKGYFSTRKEVLRLFDIYLSREKEGMQEKMGNIKKLVSMILLIPKLNKLFRNILKELDMDKIRFDEIDTYWVSLREENYNYNIQKL
jgi:hypothetical protein